MFVYPHTDIEAELAAITERIDIPYHITFFDMDSKELNEAVLKIKNFLTPAHPLKASWFNGYDIMFWFTNCTIDKLPAFRVGRYTFENECRFLSGFDHADKDTIPLEVSIWHCTFGTPEQNVAHTCSINALDVVILSHNTFYGGKTGDDIFTVNIATRGLSVQYADTEHGTIDRDFIKVNIDAMGTTIKNSKIKQL
jgi:hypothetical protein